jgi:hypothetical protein
VRAAEGRFALLAELPGLPDTSTPILMSDLHIYLQLFYYGPPELRRRLTYISGENPQATFQMQLYRPWISLNVASNDEMLALSRFYIYVAGDDILLNEVLGVGATVTSVADKRPPSVFPRPGYIAMVTMPTTLRR